MAVFRINRDKNYTIMSNYPINEKDMSLKAKGLIATMLSLPNDWDYSIAGLVSLSKDGKESVIGALKELEKHGYLIRTRLTDSNGRFNGYQYDIYEKPQTDKPFTEKPNTVEPNTEKTTQQNTIKESKKEQSNNIYMSVLAYLNEKAGTHFRSIESNFKFIKARLNDGYTEQDLKGVIDKKVKEWKGTTMQHYLRPETLFNATKFESYMNGLETAQDKKNVSQAHEYMEHNYTEQQLRSAMVNFDDWEDEIGDDKK